MEKVTNQLPDKYSELLRLAIDDLEKCEKDDRYVIDMGTWHFADINTCKVCLAGSVMAKSLNASLSESLYPLSFIISLEEKLIDLDAFRAGHYFSLGGEAALVLNGHPRPTRYQQNPTQFKADILAIADKLEAAGL